MLRVGTDLVELERIGKSVRRERFVKMVYSEAEREMFSAMAHPLPSMAGNWAAKEAFSKSLGTGVRSFKLSEVEVLRDSLGAPFIKLTGNALQIAEKMNLDFSVSITHTASLASATVIAFSKENNVL